MISGRGGISVSFGVQFAQISEKRVSVVHYDDVFGVNAAVYYSHQV